MLAFSLRGRSSWLTIHDTCSEPNKGNSVADGFYSTEYYYTSNLLRCLADRKSSATQSEQPFFAYLPFAAPHWPLQCSAEDRDSYNWVYDDGPDALRMKRLARLKELGTIKADVVPHDVSGFGMKEWEDTDEEEKSRAAVRWRCMRVWYNALIGAWAGYWTI